MVQAHHNSRNHTEARPLTRAARAVANLARHTAYPKAASPDAVHLHIVSAALCHAVYEPFEPDAVALNAWLTSVLAGRDLCRDAWASFMAEGEF